MPDPLIPTYREYTRERSVEYRGSVTRGATEVDVCTHRHRSVTTALRCAKTMIHALKESPIMTTSSPIQTGTTPLGLRWARQGEWRLTAYAEGGYAVARLIPGVGWCCEHPDEPCPDETVASLCAALGIDP